MKRGVMKVLFFTTLLVGNSIIYANSSNDVDLSNTPDKPNTEYEENDITLNGMIGPYDPSDPDKIGDPDFSDINSEDLEGEIPDNYYTISVTVPTFMEFTVFQEPSGRGSFYSAKYSIENKTTRPIYVSVKEVVINSVQETEDITQLHLEKPIPNDDRVAIDLYLGMLNEHTLDKNVVRLSEFDNSATEDHYLGVLGLKESGILQFESTDWDVPGLDAPDKYAKADFCIKLEFSLEEPTQSTEPAQP